MKFAVQDEAAMVAAGMRLAEACHAPLVFYLHGPLGAGKTTLVRGFMRGMGYDAVVKSPTYTLIEPYEIGPWHVYHLDLYRVRDAAELDYLGLRELQDDHAIVLVEWPERGAGFLPPADVVITLDYAGEGRWISLEDQGAAGKTFLEALGGVDLNPG
ncbi:MAG: tRNA (adenosine(37)-N6)-threonylcarbamoyltransferase complex ATPase subunit type 1 TsaE [Gammaproteobacteria bacterium]|jgi:tRNA threonylcarbamoyladenosine biosynthesis protein TsaE